MKRWKARDPPLQGGRIPKLVPRVLVELGPEAPPLASEAGMRVVELLDAEVKEAGLDGVVLEVRATRVHGWCGRVWLDGPGVGGVSGKCTGLGRV